MLAQYLGVISPAIQRASLSGAAIPTTTPGCDRCDPWGRALRCASLPVATFDGFHVEMMEHIEGLLQEAGITFETEPAHIFQSLIPAAVLLDRAHPPGIIPDFAADLALPPHSSAAGPGLAAQRQPRAPIRRLFLDVKGLHGGRDYASRQQSQAVTARAARVDVQYRAHATRLDQQHSPGMAVPGAAAPIAARLQQFGAVRGLVFGKFAEASPDVHHLADYLGDCIARRRWRLMGAASQSEARSFTVARVRRILGVGAARAMARHLIRRLPFLGLSRAAMDQHLQQHRARAWARPVVPHVATSEHFPHAQTRRLWRQL